MNILSIYRHHLLVIARKKSIVLYNVVCTIFFAYYTIIERDWAKYRDLSVASRSIIFADAFVSWFISGEQINYLPMPNQ